MLYERWRQVAEKSAGQVALVDLASGDRWTFRQLETACERSQGAEVPVIFPFGSSAEFILTVLHAWRARRVVCPLETGQPLPVLPAALPKGVVHLKLTSATTTEPRLIACSAEQLVADVENIVTTMGLRPDWPNIGIISLAHSYGFSNLVLPLLLRGIPLILPGAALPESLRLASDCADHVTLPAVPALWQTWHKADAVPGNVRLAISAGAPLPLSLEQDAFEQSGLKIHNFYGSSECGGIAYDGTAVPRTDSTCAGAPLRHVDVSVGDDGCIVVRSEAVALGYWPQARPELGAGVFRTHDLGEVSDGLVHLRGRASDQINIAGRKVSPETIERVLLSHPEVQGCVVFGVPGVDEHRGEVIVACVAAEPGLTVESIRQYGLSGLPSWQVPREWWLVDEIQVNYRGKLPRAHWRARFLEKRFAGERMGGEGQD